MPSYRYYTTDLLTGQIIADLPLYGVWFGRVLSKAGSFTGTYKLGTGIYDDRALLEASEPGKTALYVERNGELIWGGIIWTRTWASNGKTMQLSGQTFESIFEKILIQDNVNGEGTVYPSQEQMVLFKALIDHMQAQGTDQEFGLDTSQLTQTTGINRELTFPTYEDHMVSEAIDNIIGVARGLDYMIDVQASEVLDQPKKVVLAGYPQLGLISENPVLVYDYPGTITDYWYPESASSGAAYLAISGSGTTEAVKPRRRIRNDYLLDAVRMPRWAMINDYTHLYDQAAVDARADEDMRKYAIPVTIPTFALKPDAAASFTEWSGLGNSFMAHIEDDRFPDGKDIVSRMVGWDLSPGGGDQLETLSIAIEGGDD